MRQSTKGQIQIGETVAVLVVFLVLMVFGLYWFSSASGAQVANERAELERLELIEVAKTIMNMPELKCSTAATTDASCIDEERIKAFNQTISQYEDFSTHYKDKFFANTRGSYALTVADLQTPPNGRNITVFDFTTDDPNASSQKAAVPVILYDPVTQNKHFSMLVLRQEVAP